MEYRYLGNSTVKVSAIIFGGGSPEIWETTALESAIDNGITTIDTAPIYGFGTSEKIVGKIAARQRETLQIITKYGFRWNTSKGQFVQNKQDVDGCVQKIHVYATKNSIINECNKSLKRLGTDYIDLYLSHYPDPITPVEETFSAVDTLLKDGKILASGICNSNVKQMQSARSVSPIVVNEAPYSMVRRNIENDILPWCRKNKIGVICYSPLQDGLLSGKYGANIDLKHDNRRRQNPFFTKKNRAKVELLFHKIDHIACKYQISLSQLVLNWTIYQPGIVSAIVGMRSPQHAIDAAKAAEFQIDRHEMEQIHSFAREIHLDLTCPHD